MENVVHKIYHLTFPNNETYVGSTSQTFRKRYTGYRSTYKISDTPICEVSIQYMFEEVKMVEVDRIECIKSDPKIKILEEEWKKKLNPTLNIRRAFRTKEEKSLQKLEWGVINREQVNTIQRKYDTSTKGRLNSIISDAKAMIKHHTKKNNPNMVKKWEGILEERIQSRLASQSS